MSRVVYAKDEDINLSFEILNDCLFVHVVLNRFSKAVLEKLKTVWEHMKQDAYMDGWEGIYTYTKDPRIVNIIGGAEFIKEYENVKVFRWELK